MANREWNPKSFFRHLTPDALEVLLEWAAVELTLDGDGPVGEQVYRGWKALPDAERIAIETKLLPVNDLCGPHARPYLERLERVPADPTINSSPPPETTTRARLVRAALHSARSLAPRERPPR